MAGIDLTISLWGKERRVEASPLLSGAYHLYIDKYFQGQIFMRQGKFIIEYINRCDLTGDDLQGLLDAIQDKAKKD